MLHTEKLLRSILLPALLVTVCLWLSASQVSAQSTVYPGTGSASKWTCTYDGNKTLTLSGSDQTIAAGASIQDLFGVPENVASAAETLVVNSTGKSGVSFNTLQGLPNVRTLILKGNISAYYHETDAGCPIASIIGKSSNEYFCIYMNGSYRVSSAEPAYTTESIETVDIQGGLYEGQFGGCPNLKQVHIGRLTHTVSDTTTPSYLSFWADTALTSVVIDQTAEDGWRAPLNAFRECSALADLRVGGTLKQADGYAFDGCTSLKTFPDLSQVETISSYAFRNCTHLKEVDISGTVEMNGHYMFAHCENLARVHFARTGTVWVDSLFYDCPNLKSFTVDTMEEPVRFAGCDFYRCESLEFIRMPLGFEQIGMGEFYGCTALKSIPTLENLTAVSASLSYVPETSAEDGNTGMFDGCENLTEVVFPEDPGITELSTQGQTIFLDKLTFQGCRSLERVVLPKNTGIYRTSLASGAFEGCASLTEVQLPNIRYIFGNEFSGCDALEILVLPTSLVSVKSLTNGTALRLVYCAGDCPDYIKNGSESTVFGQDASVRVYYIEGNESWETFLADEAAVSRKYPNTEFTSCRPDQVGQDVDPEIIDVSDENSKENYIYSPRTIPFHYSASNGKRRQFSFVYSDSFFFQNENGIDFFRELALASLSAAMSGYSDIRKISTNAGYTATLPADDYSRAYNIHELYSTLKFSGPEFYNYDKPLNDASDKVAFSIAHKYINAGETEDDTSRGEDTVIAVVVRGGCYGAEWASNFNVVNGSDFDSDHYGFKMAADEVEAKVNSYVAALNQKDNGIRGQLKVWITGYSRGAAVANKVAHDFNQNGVGGREIHTGNMYAYTFATPNIGNRIINGRRADISYHSFKKDADIFNIVSPADLVPRAPLFNWGYGRYGQTLFLPTDNYDGLWAQYETLSGKTLSQTEWIASGGLPGFDQQSRINAIELLVFGLAPERIRYRVMFQDIIWKNRYDANQKPSDPEDNLGGMLNDLKDICEDNLDEHPVDASIARAGLEALTFLKAEITNLGRVHEPEHYYAHLFLDKLDTVEDFMGLVPLDRLIIRGWDPENPNHVLVIYQNGAPVGSIRGGEIWTDHNVTCDETGAVTSREQTVGIAEVGGTYYIEFFEPGCTVEMTSDAEETVSLTMEKISEYYTAETTETKENVKIEADKPLSFTEETFAELEESEPVEPEPAAAPGATSILKLKAGKKRASLKWRKVADASGYEVQYSLKKNFKAKKTVRIKDAQVTSRTIKKLKKGKVYYFRIRTYRTSDGTKLYSAWSKKKKTKIR